MEKIEVRRLEKEDLEQRVSLLNDNRVAPFLNVNERFTLNNTIEWFQENVGNTKRMDYTFLLNNEIIGMGGIVNINNENNNGELYIYLSPDFQGRGLGKASLIEMIKVAFEEIEHLQKIYLYTFDENTRANRMYEHVGFRQEGFLRKHTYHQGELKDRRIYSIFREDVV